MKIKRAWWRRSKELSCREVGEVLHGYLDRELDDADRVIVAEHLEKCRECGLEASTYERIKAALVQPAAQQTVDADALERLRNFGSSLAADDS